MASGENPEGDVEEEEDEEERDRRAEGTEEEDQGDDTGNVSLCYVGKVTRAQKRQRNRYSRPHDQEDTKSRVELRLEGIGLGDLELGDVEACERDPERAVRGEGSGTKGVSTGPLLNASDELSKTTVGEGKTQNDVGVGDVTGLVVEEGEDESGTTETDMLV